MAYRTKNSKKGERKAGIDAVKHLKADPNYSADYQKQYAQLNLDTYRKIDDMDDATFIQQMNFLRQNDPNGYANFWWWRLAEEQAGMGAEDDCDTGESRYRVFMITQFLAAPFSDEWEDDRQTLKPGITPWITEDQIWEGLDHKSIKRYLWCWHDRDIYTPEDEITDRAGRIKAGDKKFKHAHIVVDIPCKVPVSTVARWFGVPANMVTICRGKGAFLDAAEYLPHESPKAVEQGKTHYDDDEMHASPGFDFRKEFTDMQANRAKYGKRAGEMSPADTMRMHVMRDGWTMRECREDDPLTYSKIKNTLPPLRLDYLLDAPPCPFRLTIYVDGPGGIGKSSFTEYLAQALCPESANPFFHVGNDKRVTFDGYDGEPAVIYDDLRAADFLQQFGANGVYKLLDPHPKKMAQNAKYTRVILNNTLNIINGIDSYEDFISMLATGYTDYHGWNRPAEDENQAWRRFPMIICVHENDFDILINKGFVNRDLSAMKTMEVYANVRGSLKSIVERLDGSAKEQVYAQYGQPVIEAAHMITENHDDKISDPEQVPDTMVPVVKYSEDIEAEKEAAREAARERFIEEYEAEEMKRFDTLVEFAHWFWKESNGYDDYGYNDYMNTTLYIKFRNDENYKKQLEEMQAHKRDFETIGGIKTYRIDLDGYEYQYLQKLKDDDGFFVNQIYSAAEKHRVYDAVKSYSKNVVRQVLEMAFYDEL